MVKKTILKTKAIKTDQKADKAVSKKELQLIEAIVKELMALIGISDLKLKISVQENTVCLDLNCTDPGMLIGNHGEVVSSLQLTLSLMVYKKLGRWVRLVVNVADWLETRDESLKKMALNTAQRVKFSSQAVALPFLSSVERRIIHLVLADHPDVVTESQGEGKDRRLIVKPKQVIDERK